MNEYQGYSKYEREKIKQLEQAIFRARDYVVPSPDLRPRTLEDAKDYCTQKRRVRRLGLSAAAACLVWLLFAPTFSSLSGYSGKFSGPTQMELEHTAIELSHSKGYGFNWGLVDAFLKLRNIHQNQ
jgi:hypothetical protein